MDRSKYAELFLAESREHVSRINRELLALESDASTAAPVEEIFRAVHTLKGMSAAMGYTRSAALAHALEHVLDQLRSGALVTDADVTDALFDGVDALERAIDSEAAGPGEPFPDQGREGATSAGGRPAGRPGEGTGDEGPGRTIRVNLMIRASAPLPAVRAVLALRQARNLGEVRGVDPSEERLAAGDFNGTLAFRLRTDRDEDEIRAALEAAGEVAQVTLEEVEDGAGADPRRDEVRPEAGALIRIRQDRLDALVDQIGELVIARDRLGRLARIREDEELDELAGANSRLVGELRDQVMELRMVPVGEAFERFPRLVRDAARALGRRVVLRMSGQDVELDRSLLNELSDLLVHLLRNAVDHGIEPPEERAGRGKPESGEIRLSAWRDRSQIAVRVEDDGRGIDREAVVRAARLRGLLSADEAAELPDPEVFALLSQPGFSTAAQVTELSGRGVGLDMVVNRLRALGGGLEVQSEAGSGSSFTLRLPLSLAIVRCLEVAVGAQRYLVPLSTIDQVAEVQESSLLGEGEDRLLPLREADVPLLRLRPLLAPADQDSIPDPVQAVVVHDGSGPLALEVDGLIGQHESVLKPFDAAAEMLPFFSGAALLADGRPALVIDSARIGAWARDPARRRTMQTTEPVC